MKNLSSLFATLALAALLCTFSCKKKDKVDSLPTDYASLSLKYIKEKESAMIDTEILAINADGTLAVPLGTVFAYKTSEGRFGKFKVVNYGAAPARDLTISLVTYNADGTVKVSKDNLLIRSTYQGDLDTGVEQDASSDIFWRSSGWKKFWMENGAKMVQYNF